jgi:hypothetical protein
VLRAARLAPATVVAHLERSALLRIENSGAELSDKFGRDLEVSGEVARPWRRGSGFGSSSYFALSARLRRSFPSVASGRRALLPRDGGRLQSGPPQDDAFRL